MLFKNLCKGKAARQKASSSNIKSSWEILEFHWTINFTHVASSATGDGARPGVD